MSIAKKGDPCRCPHHEGACTNFTSEPKWFMCHPCSLGWHVEGPCPRFRSKEFEPHCGTCGWPGTSHSSGPASAAKSATVEA